MKKLPIILTLLLAGAWGYTSWYWYTCNIKGFCDNKETVDVGGEILSYDDVVSSNGNVVLQESDDEIINPNNSSSAPKLGSGDVLSGNNTSTMSETTTQVDELQEDKDVITSSGSETSSQDATLSGSIDTQSINAAVNDNVVLSLCESPLVGPLSSATTNDAGEMRKLETFLLQEFPGEASIGVDGIFGNEDFELVKKLQLKYKEQMLDPWGLEAPTGYVGRTTVATINSISCN